MDLFSPIIDEQKLHPNFRTISHDKYAQAVINDWARGFEDRDGKFVREFQTTFNSSFWELYLFACLKYMNLEVDFSYSSPDFVVSKSGEHLFCIEASIANNPQDSSAEWERDISIESISKLNRNEVVEFATIRLANTLNSKYKKYKKSYAELGHVKNKPFILAIAPFEQPFFYVQNDQAMRRVLYSYDKPIYKDFPEENTRVILGHEYMESIIKSNGSEVPLGIFASEGMEEISAVIFSNTATLSKVRALSADPRPVFFEVIRYNNQGLNAIHEILSKEEYKESLLDGLHIFHNPVAKLPLPRKIFNRAEVTQHFFDLKEREVYCDVSDGALFQRSSIVIGTQS